MLDPGSTGPLLSSESTAESSARRTQFVPVFTPERSMPCVAGTLEAVSRGVYRIADEPPLGNPDLVIAAARIPSGVICLISALAFHELTTQIPHEVHVALPRGAEEPRLDYPPIHIPVRRQSIH